MLAQFGRPRGFALLAAALSFPVRAQFEHPKKDEEE